MESDTVIDLLVITDGRQDCIEQTVESARDNLDGDITGWWMYDDSGDPQHREWLDDQFGREFNLFWHPDGRQGFGGAIRAAWQKLRCDGTGRFVFHLEDDFVFNRPVPIDDMIEILDEDECVAQVALRRQAWNDTERAAGGVVEANPDEFVDVVHDHFVSYLEHRLFWTTNPSLYRRQLIFDVDWPTGEHSEGQFTRVLRDVGYRFAYLGDRSDPPWVHHIGKERHGTGY